ncbi:type IV pilus assembly protein PilB [Vreelandella songnenensis]|uniref:Type IV pilus assembly protein PilB n=1 Tax=Vreelandella songnenensis TaxID=1176243 RepID=A0A2T0V693_9GAMM|nr:type IV-A pilus assembly ATPase PilB [Halomonas songnenensis]PRY65683.1 type IV pilus assembly protein PilB [Halomonas songnenensis]
MSIQGFATYLFKRELLTFDQAIQAQADAEKLGISLLRYAVEHELLDAITAASVAAEEYGLPLIDLEAVMLDALPPANAFPGHLLKSLGVLPLSQQNRQLSVAISCPSQLPQLRELAFAVDAARVEGVLAPITQLDEMLNSYLSNSRYSSLDKISDITISSLTPDNEDLSLEETLQNAEEGPVVEFVNKVLLDAIDRNASDIHFEPYEHHYRIRFRIDGVLIEIANPPLSMRNQIAARLKIMARLDISERRLPQDGAIKLKLSHDRALDLRINSLPTVHGEKIVLRLLDPAAIHVGIEQLGFTNGQQILYEHALRQPQGMILVTGPTGSGKTVSLYTGIGLLNEQERNICTAEDPVEIKVAGINQVNVLPKIGLDFANALRAFLRQDPDVVMIGEIRDLETADIAVKAAQTGHLVLSTLHTNSAAQTLARLSNIGVSSFNIASSVTLVIAQRLARKLCGACKTAATLPPDVLRHEGFTEQEIEHAALYRPVGCKKCTHGYKGRIGIYEVVPISESMQKQIMHNESVLEIDRQIRKEGHPSLRQSGFHYVMQGLTSLEEINRVTKE